MKKKWDEEALKYNLYPLYDDVATRTANVTKIFEKYFTIRASKPLTAGKHEIKFEYEKQDGNTAKATLSIDGVQVGQGTIDNVVLSKYSISEPFDVGGDNGGAVARKEYTSPFRFSDKLDWVRFDLK